MGYEVFCLLGLNASLNSRDDSATQKSWPFLAHLTDGFPIPVSFDHSMRLSDQVVIASDIQEFNQASATCDKLGRFSDKDWLPFSLDVWNC